MVKRTWWGVDGWECTDCGARWVGEGGTCPECEDIEAMPLEPAPTSDRSSELLGAYAAKRLRELKNNWNHRAERLKLDGDMPDHYCAGTMKQCARELHKLIKELGA